MLLNWNNNEFSLEQVNEEISLYYKDWYTNSLEQALFTHLKDKEGYLIN